MIRIENLCYSAGGQLILSGVNAEIEPGRVTALVGPNGAGKSTLLSLIGGLTEAGSGTVEVCGRRIEAWHRAELSLTLTTLRQQTHIVPRLTVRELVAFGRYPHSRGHLNEMDDVHIAQAMEDMELAPLADRQLDTLSGGQRQRALIAMCLAQTTQIMLLDEPLNNLDLNFSRRVMEVVRDRSRAGRAIVTVLHDLTIAARTADQIIALKNGRVMASGPPSTVITPEILSDLYDADVEVYQVGGKPVVLPI